MPSLVAEIGDVIENHLRFIGLIKDEGLDEHQKNFIAEKRDQYIAAQQTEASQEDCDYPDGAQLCAKCHTKAMIQMDGCLTCLNCGESKCG